MELLDTASKNWLALAGCSLPQQQSQSSWSPAAITITTVVLPAVAREAGMENKLQPRAMLVGVLGKLWKAQGHYSKPCLFPTTFRSSPVAASLPHCCQALLFTITKMLGQRMMLVILFCPRWHALQLAKTFGAAQSSVELRLAVTKFNAAGA